MHRIQSSIRTMELFFLFVPVVSPSTRDESMEERRGYVKLTSYQHWLRKDWAVACLFLAPKNPRRTSTVKKQPKLWLN